MHGCYEDITNVALLLTEPSQVSEVGPREGEQQAPLHPCGSRGDGSRVSASHPETATPCGAKQHRSPIPGRQPQHKPTHDILYCHLSGNLADSCQIKCQHLA